MERQCCLRRRRYPPLSKWSPVVGHRIGLSGRSGSWQKKERIDSVWSNLTALIQYIVLKCAQGTSWYGPYDKHDITIPILAIISYLNSDIVLFLLFSFSAGGRVRHGQENDNVGDGARKNQISRKTLRRFSSNFCHD